MAKYRMVKFPGIDGQDLVVHIVVGGVEFLNSTKPEVPTSVLTVQEFENMVAWVRQEHDRLKKDQKVH